MSKEELLKYLIAEIDLIMHDKDYRFENANGTWYSRESCRDLTNEEVFEELRTELRQLAELEAKLAESKEQLISMNEKSNKIKKESYYLKQQLAETDKLMKEYLSKCLSLEQQLAEKEKELAYMTKQAKKFNNEAQKYYEDAYCNNFQNQKAIRELEKVKRFLLEKIAEKQSCFNSGNYNDFADGVKTICELMLISIDKQIKELKGEK